MQLITLITHDHEYKRVCHAKGQGEALLKFRTRPSGPILV